MQLSPNNQLAFLAGRALSLSLSDHRQAKWILESSIEFGANNNQLSLLAAESSGSSSMMVMICLTGES